jgi:peroxiredoxin
MAQLRQDYQKFVDRNAEIVVVGPDKPQAFKDYWRKEGLPFVGLADPTHAVAKRYGQEIKLLKWGRMPALMVIDKEGQVAYRLYGNSMSDIPPSPQILSVLDRLEGREAG